MKILESGEMYLETIYVLSMQKSAVRSIDVSEYMSFSKPSVSRAVNLLKAEEYINVDRNGFLTLTDKGLGIAEKIYERHTVLTALLTRLGVPAEIAERDACRVEHVLSDETFDAIKAHLSH